MFHRRVKPTMRELLRTLMSRQRRARARVYVEKRWLRLRRRPHALALGAAIGVAVSFTPFLGFHLLITLALARLARASVFGAVLGTLITNPLTLPFIAIASVSIGAAMWAEPGGGWLNVFEMAVSDIENGSVATVVKEFFWFYTVGGALLGLVFGALTYLFIHLRMRQGAFS